MERRSTQRCPVCQGPAVTDANAPEGLRCRNSICVHNHADAGCPRCGARGDLENVTYADGRYVLTCAECLNVWKSDDKG